jgi:hypothetical protein
MLLLYFLTTEPSCSEWCGNSTFESSYAATTTAFAQYNVVAYFSEFGCISSPPRLWTESVALFSTDMNTVWSGGIAFSYFPAASAAGQFGMVTISQDTKTVTTSDDFNTLKTEYGLVSFINSPSQSSVTAAAYPSCAASSDTFLASATLPPTPDEAACNCLENALSCRFTPATNNYTAVVGDLLNVGCSLLGQSGGSCTDIGGNGSTGVYGRIADCDPSTSFVTMSFPLLKLHYAAIKLSYVMSQYYEANGRNAQSCSFAGNGTVNSLAPSSVSVATAAASSCIANPSAVFTPTPVSATNGGATGKATATGKTGNAANAAFGSVDVVLLSMSIMAVFSVIGGVWTLA